MMKELFFGHEQNGGCIMLFIQSSALSLVSCDGGAQHAGMCACITHRFLESVVKLLGSNIEDPSN